MSVAYLRLYLLSFHYVLMHKTSLMKEGAPVHVD